MPAAAMPSRARARAPAPQAMRASIPYIHTDLPVLVVFRALGFVADRDILEHIVYDFGDTEMMEALRPSIEEALPINSQEARRPPIDSQDSLPCSRVRAHGRARERAQRESEQRSLGARCAGGPAAQQRVRSCNHRISPQARPGAQALRGSPA